MNYYDDNKLCSVNEFYENAKKLKKELKKTGKATNEEIEQKKALLLGAQFVSKKYIELMEEAPEEYPEVLPADIMGEMEFIDAVHDYMLQHGDGEKVLDSYPLVSAAIMVKKSHTEIVNAGIESDITERIVHSVVPAIEAVTLKAIKHAPQFNIGTSNVINAQKILRGYPEIVKVMMDEATRTVFTNKAERNQWSTFTVHNGNASDTASILLSQSVTAAHANKVLIESDFSIYDWAVMEAIVTLYAHAEAENKLDNGAVTLDIKSIDKIVIERNGKIIHEMYDQVPGEEVTYVDNAVPCYSFGCGYSHQARISGGNLHLSPSPHGISPTGNTPAHTVRDGIVPSRHSRYF